MYRLTPSRVELNRLAEQVAALEEGLRASPPAPGGILFYGSSTMVLWREEDLLQRQMAPLPVLSTGFGGSTAEEALYYYQRLVLPARPSILVYYEGARSSSSRTACSSGRARTCRASALWSSPSRNRRRALPW